VEVAVQRVEVPVEIKTLPLLPMALVESCKAPERASLVIVVVAKVEVAFTVKPEVVLKVNNEEVANGEVLLPNRISPAVTEVLPVPPFPTGKVPVTLVVKSMVELVMSALTIKEEDKRPALLLWTTPAVLKAVTVGAWETVRLVMVEVPRVEVALTVKPELAEKVNREEVPIVVLPWPKRMSLATRFCKEIVGVVPPVEVMEPEPETEVT
jgi:hypothetical protein